MNAFVTPEWESNPIADKTCEELFKGSSLSARNRKKKNKKANRNESQVKSGLIEKQKSKQQLKKLKNTLKSPKVTLHNAKDSPQSKSPKILKKERTSLETTGEGQSSSPIKKNKYKLTHQTLFCQTSKKKRDKTKFNSLNTDFNKSLKNTRIKNASEVNVRSYQEKLNIQDKFSPKTAKKLKLLPLRERMLEKLKAARFRYLNEQMYTTTGHEAKKYFENDPEAFGAYHEGYRQQVEQWPVNPVDIIIEKIKKLPRTHVIADFGCGEAKLAKSVLQKVHSFDLVAVNSFVTPCDMAHVPLEDSSVDVAVFCLSLMGTNMRDYLLEAHRVLKVGGLLKVAEVESRFNGIDNFIKSVEALGFTKISKNLSCELFCFLDFKKKDASFKAKKKLPDIQLEPCIYKKR